MQIRIIDKTNEPKKPVKQGIECFAEDQDLPFNVIDE